MQALMENNSISVDAKEKMSASLKRLLEEDILIVDSCYYFKREFMRYDDRYTNKTGNECFGNRLIIEFENRNNEKGLLFYLKQGIAFSNMVARKLEDFNENFTLILMIFDKTSIVFRFHKTRGGEEWLIPDIEQYAEPFFVIDVLSSPEAHGF
ncbi:MAG: hypothetical protein CVU06_09700 [Bacteroidetes bacterium HGW-Bacteroidetes-22]|nr:MAG: hypothetical protein CVU06_09700 [Bacteroidetes bacterium HGW-Bacteroidetes-22]